LARSIVGSMPSSTWANRARAMRFASSNEDLTDVTQALATLLAIHSILKSAKPCLLLVFGNQTQVSPRPRR
jgi:hypothetical protein